MAGKLGTSDHVDRVRMSATMAEFIAAKLLTDAGYRVTPEAAVSTARPDGSAEGYEKGTVPLDVDSIATGD